MARKVGIGIIGTGFARKVQIPAFLACENAFIASVASGNPDNARAVADEFQIGHTSTDWRETVLHPEVDLVCITTPPDLHREMTLFGIEQGKHILCEKPMAMDVVQAREMTDAAKGKPMLALIDHELRFQPGRQIAYKMLRDGAIGKVRHAKAIFQAPGRGNPRIPWNWWSDANAGGGSLGAIGSHIIDSVHWFLDTKFSSVYCQLQTQIKERTAPDGNVRNVSSDDEANMLLRLSDGELTKGATGLVSISMIEYPKYQNSLEFYGTDGAMRIASRGELFLAKATDNDWNEFPVDLAQPVGDGADTGFARAFGVFAPHIVEAIRSEAQYIEHAATFEDGLNVQIVLDAARRSNAQKGAVSIDSDLN